MKTSKKSITPARSHFLEIEFTRHRGLDIKSTSAETLKHLDELIKKQFPAAKTSINQFDPENSTEPLDITIGGLENQCQQAVWWLLKKLCNEEGWDIFDTEYLSPSNVIFCLKRYY